MVVNVVGKLTVNKVPHNMIYLFFLVSSHQESQVVNILAVVMT